MLETLLPGLAGHASALCHAWYDWTSETETWLSLWGCSGGAPDLACKSTGTESGIRVSQVSFRGNIPWCGFHSMNSCVQDAFPIRIYLGSRVGSFDPIVAALATWKGRDLAMVWWTSCVIALAAWFQHWLLHIGSGATFLWLGGPIPLEWCRMHHLLRLLDWWWWS